MPFFDDVPPAPEPQVPHVDTRRPDWAEPPRTTVGGSVGLGVLLLNTGDAAAWIHDLCATPTGITFSLTAMTRAGGDDPLWPERARRDGLRFGVGLSDGRKATSDMLPSSEGLSGDETTEISLRGLTGHGNGRTSTQTYWLWPLPPPGPLTFAVSWPAEGIAETTVEVDTGPLREAAARAVELWPDDRPLPPPEGGGSWSSYF
jgi:hypothetical protein